MKGVISWALHQAVFWMKNGMMHWTVCPQGNPILLTILSPNLVKIRWERIKSVIADLASTSSRKEVILQPVAVGDFPQRKGSLS